MQRTPPSRMNVTSGVRHFSEIPSYLDRPIKHELILNLPCLPSLSRTEQGADTDSDAKSPADRADGTQAVQEVMDVEGVHLEEATHETSQGEDSELSLSFQGYVAELRQCQSKMRNAQMPRNPPEGKDCGTDLYKATVVWGEPPLLHFWSPRRCSQKGNESNDGLRVQRLSIYMLRNTIVIDIVYLLWNPASPCWFLVLVVPVPTVMFLLWYSLSIKCRWILLWVTFHWGQPWKKDENEPSGTSF